MKVCKGPKTPAGPLTTSPSTGGEAQPWKSFPAHPSCRQEQQEWDWAPSSACGKSPPWNSSETVIPLSIFPLNRRCVREEVNDKPYMHIQFKSAHPINFITCRLPHLPVSFSPVTFSLCISPKLGWNGSVTVGITFVLAPKSARGSLDGWVPCRRRGWEQSSSWRPGDLVPEGGENPSFPKLHCPTKH